MDLTVSTIHTKYQNILIGNMTESKGREELLRASLESFAENGETIWFRSNFVNLRPWLSYSSVTVLTLLL